MTRTKGSKNRQNRSNQKSLHPAKEKAEADALAAKEAEEVKAKKEAEEIEVKKIADEAAEKVKAELQQLKDEEAEQIETKETVEEKDEIKEPQFLDKFWFGNVFVPGVGTVNGRVRDDHFEIFKKKFESGQSKLPKADRLTLNIDYWVRDNDELDKKLQEGKKQQA